MEQEPKQQGGMALLWLGAAAMFLAVILLAVLSWDGQEETVPAMAPLSAHTAAAESAEAGTRMVIPVGKAVGIKLFSDGVLVVGLSPVETDEGSRYPGRDSGLKTGDLITHIDGEEVDTIEEIQKAVAQRQGDSLAIQAVRGQQQLQLTVSPVENSQGVYQLGVWLRDSMAGIGTMTFYDPDSQMFAALGHGINDVDTAMLMPLESGSIMPATVADVKKGTSGQPGELHGEFDLTTDLGTLYANTSRGIFGHLAQQTLVQNLQPVPVARQDEVKVGEAEIRSNIRGDQVETFSIRITRVSDTGDGTRSLMLEVTDPRLLESTGGIVQGMSGSPILQNGKLVGAVTHVLVNDPTRGYGILAQDMLDQAGLAPQAKVS
ncbi:SpoIVB peptidase [Pseudoflavonifractor sp. AF19-9AC]|uniref:SpoIVB peptidase n=1 Tax=Pseudoflavonifractor sp. AF19-9AC TaxID=2292244 RepID=UPI001FAA7337|nr:SpoIVB peptidase [Pseudoflavonifractor sp. AF19-9AC]